MSVLNSLNRYELLSNKYYEGEKFIDVWPKTTQTKAWNGLSLHMYRSRPGMTYKLHISYIQASFPKKTRGKNLVFKYLYSPYHHLIMTDLNNYFEFVFYKIKSTLIYAI